MLIKIKDYLNESISSDISNFLIDKPFLNNKSKRFYYHGTKKSPNDFELKADYNFEDSNIWSGDLPEGYLFLTTSIIEALAYGKFIIPCEFKKYDSKVFNINTDNPSKVFDMDYGIDLNMPDKQLNIWQKFEDSYKNLLIINGTNKQTIITDIDNIIPRIDLANIFYKK